jgi:PAS domain S-box-containing protein
MESFKMTESAPPGTSSVSLLCVDDDERVLEALRVFFRREPGFIIETCKTASGALELLNHHHFDVIIADYAMPDMDGIAFLKEVRSRGNNALFIIFTGRHIARVAIEALNNGGNYYLQKGGDIYSELPRLTAFIKKRTGDQHAVHPHAGDDHRYRSVVENPLEFICCFLPDGKVTLVNELFAQFVKQEGEKILDGNFFTLIPEKERDAVLSNLHALSRVRPGAFIEHGITAGDGTVQPVEWAYRVILDASGSVEEYQAQGRDVAGIVRIAATLSLPETRIPASTVPTVLDLVSDSGTLPALSPEPEERDEWQEISDSLEPLQYPVFAINKNGVVIAWNNAIGQLTGIPAKDMVGKGAFAYAVPFYGKARPMLIDYITHPPGTFDPDSIPPITRDENAFIGEVEPVVIRGKPMLLKGMGTRIHNAKGNLIAAVQSIMVTEQPPGAPGEPVATTEEQYIGGISSITVKVTGGGLAGSIAGALGSATGGYGVYATNKRLFVVHNPELDASRDDGLQFGAFIINELFGTSVDVTPRSIAELERLKVFEVWREEIASIDMKAPRLLAGYLIFRTKAGETFRVFIDHKKAFLHLEKLLIMSYPEILMQEQSPDTDSPKLLWLDMADEIEQVQYPIFAIDKSGVVIAWNNAIAQLTGVPQKEIIGKGDHAYAIPFHGRAKPMIIDYVLLPPDATLDTELPVVTRDGDTFVGDLEFCIIQGKPVMMWGKGSGIYDTGGAVIAAVQSILVSEQEKAPARSNGTFEEHYIGGISSTTVKVPGDGLTSTIAGAIGSTTGGFGVYATDQRLFVVHNPELDATRHDGIQFGTFIMDELFGTSIDMRPRTIPDLERLKVFEVLRKDIESIETKEPMLLAGYITFRTRDGETFRVYIDHKKTFVHITQLLKMFYPEVL